MTCLWHVRAATRPAPRRRSTPPTPQRIAQTVARQEQSPCPTEDITYTQPNVPFPSTSFVILRRFAPQDDRDAGTGGTRANTVRPYGGCDPHATAHNANRGTARAEPLPYAAQVDPRHGASRKPWHGKSRALALRGNAGGCEGCYISRIYVPDTLMTVVSP